MNENKYNVILHSCLKPDEIIDLLQQNIRSETYIKKILKLKSKYFQGKISGNTFCIHRLDGLNNFFPPKIHGSIIEECEGCKIYIKIQIQSGVLIAIAISSLIFSFIFFFALNIPGFAVLFILPLTIVTLVNWLIMKYGANKTLEKFKILIKAKEL